EIELSVLTRQCMDDYFDSREQLAVRIAPWERSRNDKNVGIHWRFTTADARIKLKKLYPVI
ncbi:IS630 family transposase, partial [Candidatus Bathyarchaeota archaeon]|nr:IS630 family transposase [Candidatus Bathyarchaeota archaeon]